MTAPVFLHDHSSRRSSRRAVRVGTRRALANGHHPFLARHHIAVQSFDAVPFHRSSSLAGAPVSMTKPLAKDIEHHVTQFRAFGT